MHWRFSDDAVSFCSCDNNVGVVGNGNITNVGECAANCNCATIDIDAVDINSGPLVSVFYQCCNGEFFEEVYGSPGTYTLCNLYIHAIARNDGSGNYSSVTLSTWSNTPDSTCNCAGCSSTC
jgi:hypothetical protein